MNPESFRERATSRLRAMSGANRRGLVEDIRKTALRRKITYEYDKTSGEEPIRILFPPIFLDGARIGPLREICLEVSKACEKALPLFLERREVRDLFPLEYEEEILIMNSKPERHAKNPAVWQRLDGAMDPAAPVESLRFLETNMNSVGGVYYAPAVEMLSVETVLPKFLDPKDLGRISRNEDLEKLLFDLLSLHAGRVGGLGDADIPRIAVVENDPDAEGCTESPAVAAGLCDLGADAFLARPEEFEISGRAILHLGRPVDLIYRLFEIREMNEMRPIDALKLAFAENRVVSGIGGEFDHKSIFELFTAAAFEKFFSPKLVKLLRRHVLWTRLLRETFTDAPDGSKIDLPKFAYGKHEHLVLKPNRSYGGDGILIGRDSDERAWQRAIEKAMEEPRKFVVQAFHPLTELPFPVIDTAGGIADEQLHIVFGFSATPAGFGIIGRASRSSVVNVARHGGLVPILRLS